jgi:hypothetical protein
MLRRLAFALLLPALPAAAQSWETYSYDAGRGAGFCPVDEGHGGDYFCFMISCAPTGGPLYIRVAFSTHDMPEEAPPLLVTVDGEPAGELTLAPLDTGLAHDYGIRHDARRDADLIEALSAGRTAAITLGTGESAITKEFTLSGSRRAIESLDTLCAPEADDPDAS